MSVTNPGWLDSVHTLQSAPAESFEHRLGDKLATADDDKAWAVLVEVITEDPCGTHEYKVAAQMLGHLIDGEVSA